MRTKFLDWIIRNAMSRRRLVLIVSLVLTLVLGAASEMLTVNTLWSALLPESIPSVREYRHIDTNFLQPGNMIVVIDGEDPTELERVTDEVADVLEHELVCEPSTSAAECISQGRYARYVYGELPVEWMTEHALGLAKPRDVERSARLMSDPRLLSYLTHLNDDFESEYSDSDAVRTREREIVGALEAVQSFVETLDGATRVDVSRDNLGRVVRDLTVGRPYAFSTDGRMSLVMVAPAIPSDDFETLIEMDRRVEAILAPLVERHSNCRIERTGLIPVGRDEMDSVGPETTVITLIALVLILALLTWNFRSGVTALIALVPIALGIVWSMGIFALTIGTLNMVTVMIGVVLLGLGIDFSIHITNRFHEVVATGGSVEEALRAAIGGTGVAVLTGAVTTAVAFLALMVADTRGIREFGFCAGLGVLTTLVAVLFVLPALLAWRTDRLLSKGKKLKKAHDFSLLGKLATGMGRLRWTVILISALATAAGFWGATRLAWEWDMFELEPEGLRSVELYDEIVDRFRVSVSVAVLTADSVDASRELREEFLRSELVGEVDDVSVWVSRPDFEESQQHIRELRRSIEQERLAQRFVEVSEPTHHDADGTERGETGTLSLAERRLRLTEEVDRLWANLVEIQALSFTAGQDRVVEETRDLVATRDNRHQATLRVLADRLEQREGIEWESLDRFALEFETQLRSQVEAMARRDEPTGLDDIPEAMRARYTSPTAPGFVMQIMPEQNLFEREALEAFEVEAARIHPNVTGTPTMMLEMNRQTIQEGRLAVLVCIGVILLVLLIDFRRPLVTLLAFTPLVSGTAFTLGLMVLLGEKSHYLNMIAWPVIIGIGVDNGVHFFHRFIQEGRDGIGRAVTSVGRAMMMSSLTTMIGFGSLMLYRMRGMASFGLVLFLGVGMCLLVTFTLLPALGRLLENRIIRETGK